MRTGERMKIIAMPLYGIGDVLMSTPALKNIREQTTAHITFLHMFRTTYDVLEQSPYVDENIHFDFFKRGHLDSLKFLLSLRGQYTASINFYPTNKRDYNCAAFVVGCPDRIGHRYANKDMAELNFLKNRTLMEDDSLHNVEENLRLLKFLGIDSPVPHPMNITLTDSDKSFAQKWMVDNMMPEGPLVGFHPGSSLFKEHSTKRWPMERFGELIKRLGNTFKDTSFLIFGGPEENDLKKTIASSSGLYDRVFPVYAKTIRETAAIMSHCSLMVSNDSGLMHMSAALQVPTVSLFGPTNPKWLAPWATRGMALRDPTCEPCFRYSPTPMSCDNKDHGDCILGITVENVYNAVSELIESKQ